MTPQWRVQIFAIAGGLLLAGSQLASGQAQAQAPARPAPLPTELPNIRHNSGQAVIPYFEGWIKNSDGSFDMVFGYFNRNFQQEFAIPAGADNRVEPSGPDAGQPTYFLPRRQRYVFRVRVPADFGKKEVVWTITANGRTERGFGSLLPAQEITERVVMTNGNFDPGHDDPNRPPTISVAPPTQVLLDTPITLVASVADDGLPKPRVTAPAPPPPAPTPANRFQAQVNSSGRTQPRGLTVSWLQYSGPAKVTMGETGPIAVSNGQAVQTARFTAPGTYKFLVTATDPGRLGTRTEVVVTIPSSRASSGQ